MLSSLRHLFRLAGGSGQPAATADPVRTAADASPGAAEPVAPAPGAGASGTGTSEPEAAFRPTDFTFVGPGGSRHLPAAELHDRAERAAALFRKTLTGRRIGLVFRSEPSLVVAWLGLVSAGFEPLILQYPTEKQNRAVWTSSIANSIQVAALDRILCAPDVAGLLDALPDARPVPFTLDDLAACTPDAPFAFRADAIIQLSSGTTGHRKAIAFTRDQVARHLNDYNAVMGLGPGDVCVSWLPLYHDMGFVACFLMPMLLGLPVVMIDPIDWVRRPALLFEAIAAHRGTYCYMPNFGYEIMAKQRTGAPGAAGAAGDETAGAAGGAAGLATMRRWVSCSEPVYADTARRFLAAHAIPAERFAACYAMAENVFAVTQSDGLVVVEVDGAEQVSCGAPIPGVELAIRDGQIHVRSATAVQAYLGGAQVADAHGFYPTGDLGHVAGGVAGGLVVTGRTGDVLNIAGRKYMLNDLDHAVNQAFPAARGRAAALASHNPRLGTEQLLVLAESEDFYLRDDAAAVAAAVAERTGVEAVDVHYVPPGFITKTSSGKINRKKTAADWAAARAFQAAGGAGAGGDGRPLAAVIAELFPKAPRDVPLGEAFDSLGLTVVRMLLEERGLTLSPGLTVADLDAAERDRPQDPDAQTEPQIRVFNLGDYSALRCLNPDYFADLSRELGVTVTYEQFCAPPAAVLLNDLIFHDYFMVRDPRGAGHWAYSKYRHIIESLKSASVIIVDDYAEYYRAAIQPAPGFDHKLTRDEEVKHLAWRFQEYTWDHHMHPVRLFTGAEVTADVEGSLRSLSRYLNVPLYRVAFQKTDGRPTATWDYVYGRFDPNADYDYADVDEDAIKTAFTGYVSRHKADLIKSGPKSGPVHRSEFFHFCCARIDPEKISQMLDRHERFLIYGPNSSAIHIREEIDRRGKTYKQIMDWAREGEPFLNDFDCVVQTGCWTPQALRTFPEGSTRFLPIYQVFWAGYTLPLNDLQPSSLWFYTTDAGTVHDAPPPPEDREAHALMLAAQKGRGDEAEAARA